MSADLSPAAERLTLEERAAMILATNPQDYGFADWAHVYAVAAGTAPPDPILADLPFVETADKTFTYTPESRLPMGDQKCGYTPEEARKPIPGLADALRRLTLPASPPEANVEMYPNGAGRLSYTPEQLKDAALWLCMRTRMANDRAGTAGALVAHAYLQEIGVLPRD